ncbi:MAG: hypothetical protein KDM81_00320 [Verrucomicrobiae bacterium]|nr:hypothetical protein [Verrucomicrobiae bacterium]MCP5523771.1 hypothetical protein [Verrucomicrobiales bacterium]
MKICPYCGKEHPDEASTCDLDGFALQPVESIPQEPGKSHTRWRELIHIAPLRLGLIVGLTHAFLSLMIFVPMVLIALLIGGGAGVPGLLGSGAILVAFAVIYGLLGFIMGLIAAAVYNFAARFIGGIQVEVRDLSPVA